MALQEIATTTARAAAEPRLQAKEK